MDTADFEAQLRRDGYDDIEVKSIEADKVVGLHSHPYDVRALVLEGSAVIACNGVDQHLKPGDVLTVDAGVPHTEHYGPQGYTFLVGRRHHAAGAA